MLFEGLSFELERGAAALVTGPNGAGKSSLVRIAAGLLAVTTGQVVVSGARALSGETAALDRDETLARAIGFWAGIDGRRDSVGAALAAFALTGLAQVPVRLLSTGQRKRAGLASVAASGAAIWLLDEPANGLDAGSIVLLEAAIAQHRADGGIALVATHLPIAVPGAVAVGLAR